MLSKMSGYKKFLLAIVCINLVPLLLAHATQICFILKTDPRVRQLELLVWQTVKPYLLLALAAITWQRIVQLVTTIFISHRLSSVWVRLEVFYSGKLGAFMGNEILSSTIYYMTFLIPYSALMALGSWMNLGGALTCFTNKAIGTIGIITVAHFMGQRRFATVLILSAAMLVPLLYNIYGAPYILLARYERFLPTEEYAGLFKLFRRLNLPSDHVVLLPGSNNAYLVGLRKKAVMVIGEGLKSMGLQTRHFEAVVAQALMKGRQYHSIAEGIIAYVLNVVKIFLLFYVINRPSFHRSFGFTDTNKTVPLAIGLILSEMFSIQLGILFSPLWNYLNWLYVCQADFHTYSTAVSDRAHNDAIYEIAKRTNFANAPLMTTFFGLLNSHKPTFVYRINEMSFYIEE